MVSAERTITINRPIDEVFTFFADAENDRIWRPAVKEITRDGPLAVGTRYRQRIAGPGGRPVAADFEITEYRPNEAVGFRGIAGPVRPTGGYRFTGDSARAVVTFALHAELTGLKKLVMSTAVQRSMDGEMANLDRAKHYLEAARGQ